MEGASIDVLFTPQLETSETLVSINITDYEPTQGITVDGNHLFGTYESVFSFSSDALNYRLGDDFETASSWDDLPSDESTQLYLWRAPQNLVKVFSYTVEMIYNYQEEGSTGGSGSGSDNEPPPAPVQRKLVKVYTKTIVGNWSKWANQLRNYVYARP
ncbi:hypothetical protein ESCO47_00008 [Escherichia phage vB_EcoM_ESCO47]|nr:hypothetical protein ESCO47_00008 [Escherichia phage vB_EcoM_ESCO47]